MKRETSFGSIVQPRWGRVDLYEEPEIEEPEITAEGVDPGEVWDPRLLNPNGVF